MVEDTPDGERIYYYRGDSDYPFYVRDPHYGYAYDDGELVEVYDGYGRPYPNYQQALLVIAAQYLTRGRGLHDAAIHGDMALAQTLGVKGTPTFFVNGRLIQGVLPLEQFDALIQEELKSAERIVARGVARKDVYGLICD